MTVWHWLSTSRYTRRLEDEIDSLRIEAAQLRQENRTLLKALSPTVRSVIDAPPINSLASAVKPAPKLDQPLRAKRKSMSDLRRELEQTTDPEPELYKRIAANVAAIRESSPAK